MSFETWKSQYHLRIDYIGNDYMFFSIPQLVVGAQTSKDVPRLRLGGQMASPRSSSSGVYTSRTETGLKAVELCMRSIGQVPLPGVSCSSRKAPFRLREVTERFRQQGVVVTIGTGCSRRIHWNPSGFEVFDK